MARKERSDRKVNIDMDELEQKMFLLKINYDKYFSGLERVEPLRDRDDLRRMFREMVRIHIPSSVQRYRFQTLRARWSSLDQYLNRNMLLIERGQHPKMKFRADLKDKEKIDPELAAQAQRVQEERAQQINREDAAFKQIFDKYMEARQACGQSTDLGFDSVRDALRKQVRQMKATYRCESVKFRVSIEEGKAKLKAVPVGVPDKVE